MVSEPSVQLSVAVAAAGEIVNECLPVTVMLSLFTVALLTSDMFSVILLIFAAYPFSRNLMVMLPPLLMVKPCPFAVVCTLASPLYDNWKPGISRFSLPSAAFVFPVYNRSLTLISRFIADCSNLKPVRNRVGKYVFDVSQLAVFGVEA